MLAIVEAFLPETGQWLGLAAMLVLVLFAGLPIRGDDNDIPGVSFLREEWPRQFDDCRRLRRLAFLPLLGPWIAGSPADLE